MEVRLSSAQYNELVRLCDDDRQFDRWLDAAAHPSPSIWVVVMPAIGWLRAKEHLAMRCFNARGYRTARVPKTAAVALTRVARELNLLHMHPALRDISLPGRSGGLIPAWRQEGERPWSEFPVAGGKFEILTPEWAKVGGLEITTWVPRPASIVAPLLDENEHLAFGIYAD